MPKLKNRPPKYAKMGKYAFVTHNGKRIYLGNYGSPESHEAYARFVAERRLNPDLVITKGESNVHVKDLAVAFLDHAEATLDKANYTHHRTVVLEFLVEFYGNIPVDEFKPSCLKTIRSELMRAVKNGKPRYCRGTINDYICRIVRIFSWGVQYQEFYDKDSCRQAIRYAIAKANQQLSDGEQIPYWTPYQIRHTAATAMENESGLDEAQALLDHSSAQTTKRYSHARLQKMKALARNRRDLFDMEGQAESEN